MSALTSQGPSADGERRLSSYAGYIVETLVTLVVVCLVAFLVLYGARRLGVGRAAGPVRLVGQLPLDRRRAIYVVRVGDKVFVVGVGDGVMTKLGELAPNELPEAPARPSPPFSEVLARVLGRKEPEGEGREEAGSDEPARAGGEAKRGEPS